MIIAVDVDGVVADLHTPWLARYNADYDDHLRVDQITDWGMRAFVKPECGDKIDDYWRDRYIYQSVLPIRGALDGIRTLREIGHRVVFVTSAHVENAGVKFHWLRSWRFLDDDARFGVDYLECHDKSLIRADLLIDDGIHNLRAFPSAGIVFTQPWNAGYDWPGRAANWKELIERYA